MRTLFLTFLVIFAFSDTTDDSAAASPSEIPASSYKKVLLVNYHNYGTYSFSVDLVDNMTEQYKEKGIFADYLPVFIDQEKYRVPYNEEELVEIEDQAKAEIDKSVSANEIDLLLLFMPIETEEHPFTGDGAHTVLQKATYSLTAVDVSTNEIVWETKFTAKSAVDLALKSKKTAKLLFKQLEQNQLAINCNNPLATKSLLLA